MREKENKTGEYGNKAAKKKVKRTSGPKRDLLDEGFPGPAEEERGGIAEEEPSRYEDEESASEPSKYNEEEEEGENKGKTTVSWLEQPFAKDITDQIKVNSVSRVGVVLLITC
jgi:hypothetical protein